MSTISKSLLKQNTAGIKHVFEADFQPCPPNWPPVQPTAEDILAKSTWQKYYRRGDKYFFKNDKGDKYTLKIEANQHMKDFLNSSKTLLYVIEKTKEQIIKSIFL